MLDLVSEPADVDLAAGERRPVSVDRRHRRPRDLPSRRT